MIESREAAVPFQAHGFVLLPGYLAAEDLVPARLFPGGDAYHGGVGPDRRLRFRDDAFACIVPFPFPSTELTEPRGARHTLQISYRRACAEGAGRIACANVSHLPVWYDFVARASARPLAHFGFPPAGHAFWTDETVAGTSLRYRGRDFSDFLRK